MQFEGYKKKTNVPNLTPLIDIVFLLLIFFMLTSHFISKKSINIELPQAETAKHYSEETPLEITISADGGYFLNDVKHELTELLPILTQQLAERSVKTVSIRGDKKSHLGKAVGLIDIANKAGADSVDIITENHD